MAGDHIHDPDLLDALEAIDPAPFRGEVWRVAWAGRDPLAGGTGGGRWHPPNDFEALYTSTEEDGALAEIYHHLSRAPVFSSSHVQIHRIAARLERTLVLENMAALAPLGIDAESFRSGDYARSREIGAAARFLDLQGLVVPSARWRSANLVLFPDRLSDRESLTVIETRDVNWPAWREASGAARRAGNRPARPRRG